MGTNKRLKGILLVIILTLTGCATSNDASLTQEDGVQYEESIEPVFMPVVENNTGLALEIEKIIEEDKENLEESETSDETVDLTQLSSVMLVAEIERIVMIPREYIGKTIKVQGTFMVYENSQEGNHHYSVIIEDALGCCEQGLGLKVDKETTYPEDYPVVGTDIEITGVWQCGEANGYPYYYILTDEIVIIE